MDQDQAYIEAKKKVEEKLGFFIHLGTYIFVNIFLIILNLTYSPQYLWFIWSILGWGIGITFHGLEVFLFSNGSEIKEKMIKKEMEKDVYK